MFVRYGTKELKRKLDEGHFQCPNCHSRRPCRLYRIERVSTANWISLGDPKEIDRFVECGVCLGQFRSVFIESALSAPQSVASDEKWPCPRCNTANPNTTYKCLKCGFSLV